MNTPAPSTRRLVRKSFGITRSFIATLSRNLALATLAAVGLGRAEAVDYTWDPTLNGGVTGGAGTWNTTTANWWDGGADVVWGNSQTSVAIFGGTAAGTVTINTGTGIIANGLTFNTTGYTIASNVAGDVLALGGVTPTITVNGAAATINSVISDGGAGITKAGTGALTLGGNNTFSGAFSVTGGTVNFGADANLGASTAFNLNGGGLNFTGAAGITLGAARILNIGAGGGSFGVAGASPTITSSKVTIGTAEQIIGSGTFTKTGAGLLTLGAANANFTGSWVVSGGVLEAGAGSLNNRPITISGTTAPTQSSATVGEVAANIDLTQNVTLAGGILSPANGNRTVSGAVTVTANSALRLQDFYQQTARNLAITGNLTGGANLTTINGAGVGIAGTAATGGTLTLTGNNSGFTGTLTAGTGTVVSINAKQALTGGAYAMSGGTLRIQAQDTTVTLGDNGINATYYNFGSNPGVASAQFAGDSLFLVPRAFTRVDSQINVPQAGGGGTLPIVPVPGFGIASGILGGTNDGILWKGLLNVTNAGSYQFKGTNDDNLVLYIDGVQVGILGVASAVTNIGTAVSLTAGSHSIVVKQTQGAGGGYARVLYNGGAGSDAPADEVLGTDAGSLTTGSFGPLALGNVTSSGTSTLDLLNDSTITNLSLGNGSLTVASQTLNTLTIGSTSITAATPTIANQAQKITFTGPISATGAFGMTFSGPSLTEFQGTNTYSGVTLVNGGQLRLNQTGAGNSIAGNLTINSANANGDIANVRLIQDDQIADTSALTMTAGILDLGANNETVNTLAMNGGRIMGAGTLTLNGLGTSTFTNGTIAVPLAGAGPLNKTGATGTLVLSANNTYTGATTISAGVLRLLGGTLGAGGVGNETTVNAGGQLFVTNTSSATESLTINDNNGLRVAGGTATFGAVSYGAGAGAPILRIDAGGDLVVNSLASTAAISKEGAGTLTFNFNVGATLPANVLHTAGVLGFNGAQSFGAVAIPAGRAFRFNADPTAGVDITAPAGTSVIAGYAAANQLLARINGASTGTLALGVDSSAALDFSADPNLSLGAVGLRTYDGILTAGANGFRFGGGGGELMVTSALTGTNNLTVAQNGVLTLRGPQTFTGSISIDGLGRLRVVNNHDLGNASNGITLTNGGTLELIGTVHDAAKVGAIFHQLGNPVNGGQRSITVGAGGGTINITSYNNFGSAYTIAGPNALTGSGNLTKTGYGDLFLVGNSDFSGNLTLDALGGRLQIRAGGKLSNVASVTVGQSAELLINNNGGLGSRQFPEASDPDRLNDAAPITLKGGSLTYNGNDAVAAPEIEAVGTVTLDVGRNAINVNKGGGTNTQGAQLTISNLVRPVGGGVVRFGGTFGTLGTATGDHGRILLNQINGVSPADGVALPWATVNDDGFAFHGGGGLLGVNTTNGIAQASGVDFTPVATNYYNFNTNTASVTLTLGAGDQSMAGFRFGNGGVATNSLLFSGATDTLYLGQGVIISDNNAQTRTIGSAAIRGNLTAGLSTSPAGAKELFVHANQGTVAVESVIIDNNGAVTVEKGTGGGTLELRAVNTYSGGTIMHSGRIITTQTGSLGSGPVTVKGGTLQLNQPGATSSTAGYTIMDRSELYLQNNGGTYLLPGDRFVFVGEGNTLTGGNATLGGGLNSLTRVNTITGPGQIVLPAGSIVRTVNAPNGVVDINMPQNLGTNADLYFNLSTTPGSQQSITIGGGTPWKGLSSAVGGGWGAGTINANGDFYLQGLNRVGGHAIFTLGAIGVNGGYTINNLAGRPINAYLEGQVVMQEDAPFALPTDLTFVVTPGAYLQPTVSQQFGADSLGLTRAKMLVQAGGTVDPGNFVAAGAAANQPFGVPYPIPSPVNAFATFEAGGRFLLNDASGIGSTTGGAAWTMKTNSILQLGISTAFLGSNAGLINSGQFVYEPGAIVRYETGRVYKHDQFINNEPNGQRTVLEIFNGNRDVTDAVNPFIPLAVGSAPVVAMTLNFGDGGMITNDDVDRTLNERRGIINLNNGAVLAGTTGTYFNITESLNFAAGATITIGANRYVDGMQKLGAVQFTGAAANSAGANAKIVVSDGAQLSLNAVHSFPDNLALDLPNAVNFDLLTGAVTPQIGNGSSLLLNTANYIEVIGALTGNGAIYTNNNVDNTALGVGWGVTSDFTFGGQFRSTPFVNRAPSLVKFGTSKLTLTGTSDTPISGATNSPGALLVYQGEVSLAGPEGRWAGGEMRIGKGATLTFDNSGTAIADRQAFGGTGNRWITSVGGGQFQLIGSAVDTMDVVVFGLGNSAGSGGFGLPGGNSGGFGKVNVVGAPGAPFLLTSLTFNQMERFDNAGEKKSVWLIRGPGVAGLPGTYDQFGTYIPNPANPVDALTYITDPNFVSGAVYDTSGGASGIVMGAPGTAIMPVRGDLLASSSATATTGEFATIDVTVGFNRTGVRALQASEYAATAISNATLPLNLRVTGAQNYTGDTRVQVAKLENGSTLSVSGLLPNLTQPAQITLTAGGILVPTGATANLSATGGTVIRSAAGISAYIHAFGDLNVSGDFYSDTGLVKTGTGTVNFAAGSLATLRSRVTIHEGTVNINDSIVNSRGTGINASAFTGPNVALNGGTLNLNGNSQFFNILESGGILPTAESEGGTLHSTAPARVTIAGGGTFSGHITGAITIDKVSNNNLLLTNTNSFSGGLKIQQGAVILRDLGALPNITTIDLNYGRLDVDNGYLFGQNNRLNSNVVFNMRGGDFVNRGRAATLTQETIGTLNLLQGHNLMQTLAGGAGATETLIGNIVRSPGATVSFQQNFGFIGTAGNNTTAIRYLPTQINGSAPALVNNILPAWMIVNNDHFATYQAGKGISFLGNTDDGFATYESGDLSTATALQNVNDGTSRTLAANTTVNVIRNAPGAAQTMTLNSGVSLNIAAGGLLTNANQNIIYTGGSITTSSSELNMFVQQGRTTIASQITGNFAVTKAGSGTLLFSGNNNYSGITYVGQGSSGTSSPTGVLEAGVASANGTTVVAIPGALQIHNSTVTVTVANSIAQSSDVTLYGGGILQMRDADNTTETLRSLTFVNAGGDANSRSIVQRAAARPTSALNLTAATPITATNENPTSTPTLSTNLGRVNFTGAGAQTLMINSPVSTNGLAAIGLAVNTNFGTVPTGIAEGGLIKAGNGMLVLAGTASDQFGNPGVPTDVFNIQSGFVRVDGSGALGPETAVTTVQSGATLLLNNGGGVTGSVRLKNNSTLSVTITGSLLGLNAGSIGTLEVPSNATVSVPLVDYFLPSANVGNITVNHKLTGSGTINLTGVEYATGYNAGGFLQLRNEANDFTGVINVGTNAVLESNTNGGDQTGNAFGPAVISLNGGVLRVRDAGDQANAAQTIAYGNNVILTADSLIDVDRLGATAAQKTIAMGNLTVTAGTKILNTPYGTNAPIIPNEYHVSFAQVDGAGTLVKGGSRYIDLEGFGVTFSGNIEVAGPKGLALPTSGNLTLTGASSTINNLTVGGFHNFATGRAVNINTALNVTNNTGAVANGLNGVITGGIVGSVTVSDSAVVTTPVVRNYGIIGSNNGTGTIVSPAIRGTGAYHAYNLPLILNGSLSDDGPTPTKLKVRGTGPGANVSLTGGNSTNTGGAEVQSGVLRVAPTGSAINPLGTGPIRVLGAPATALEVGLSQPVAALNPVLEFAGSDITQTGNITNTGTVRVAQGTTTLPGIVSGTVGVSSSLTDFNAATVPGLLEGRYTSTAGLPDTNAGGRALGDTRLPNPGNFGIQMEPRMAQMNVVTQNGLTGWSDNTAWIYTGYFYDADGIFTFMENIDDSVLVSIDGTTRLLNNTGTNPWQTVTSTASSVGQRGNVLDTGGVNSGQPIGLSAIPDNPNLPSGWHSIEFRFDNGTGGGGPALGNGFTANYGLGLNPNGTMALDGTQAFRPIDPGDGTLFRTAAGGKGSIEVAAGATLNVGGFSQTAALTFAGNGTTDPATLNVASSNSAADLIAVTGVGTPKGQLAVGNGFTVTTGGLDVAAEGTLAFSGNSTGRLVVTGNSVLNGGTAAALDVLSGTVKFESTSTTTGFGTVQVKANGTLILNGSLSGNVEVLPNGILKGSGIIGGNGETSTTGSLSVLSPGDGVGKLTFTEQTVTSLALGIGTTYLLEAGSGQADGVVFDGDITSLTIGGAWTVKLSNLGAFAPTGFTFVLFDGDIDAAALNGGVVGNPTIDYGTSGWLNGTVSYSAAGNDIVLTGVIPEPGSAALILGGLAMMAGARRVRRRD